MVMFLRLIRYTMLLGFILINSPETSSAQTLPDFSTLKVDELSDQQIESLLARATAMGYSQADIFELAKQQGLSTEELTKLGARLNQTQSTRINQGSGSPVDNTRLRTSYTDSLRSLSKRESDIFGLDFFRRNSPFLTFQPSLNVPTPRNYILGVGDELFIDIYGNSEQYYQSEVNPDGNIILEGIGPIRLSGLTVDQARQKIKSRLGDFYKDLNSENPTSFMDLSLGQTRSIKVNVVGQVELPGTFNLSAFSTVLSALYASGGITEGGTLRAIKVVRGGKLLTTLDLYNFILNGIADNDVRLEEGDVVIVGPYTNRVTLEGAVKTNAKFELNDGETLSDLLSYAGGFSEDAYTKKINLVRNKGGGKIVANVFEEQFDVFTTSAGDVYAVDKILNRFSNRVIIKGAVYRPGDYAITTDLSVKELVDRADGIRTDAFLDRALIKRTKEDLSTETVSFNLQDVLNGNERIGLQKEDVITIFSKNELKEEAFIELLGEVNRPGVLGFSTETSLNDIVLLAGGLSASAAGGSIEISRRLLSNNDDGFGLSETFVFNIDDENRIDSDTDFMMEPFDQVFIRRNPNYKRQQVVTIEGQVKSPGIYAIKNQGERISDLLNRAGGINQFAFVEGATLIRKTEFYSEPTDIEKQINDLERLREKFDRSPELLTESEMALLNRIEQNINDLEKRKESNQNLSNFAKRERIKEVIERNALTSNIQLKQAEAIGIDLQDILDNVGSVSDLLLEEGDVLIIPRKSETVRLRGKLLYPTTSRYVEGKSLKYYIDNAGGFDYRAKKKGTYVVYANGEVARTKSFIFFKFYPKPAPGAEVIVPTKPLNIPVRLQDVLAITSGLATLALVINQISQNNP